MACARELSAAQLDAPQDYSIGTVCEQFIHMLKVEYWWFRFLKTGPMQKLEIKSPPSLAQLSERWDDVEVYNLSFLDHMTPDELDWMVKPPHWDSDEAPVFVWQALLQVANHSTDHRSQILRLLYDLGVSTFEQDYLNFLDDQNAPE